MSDSTVAEEAKSNFIEQRSYSCYVCKGSHKVSACESFKKMKPADRLSIIKLKKLCFNCLDYSNHGSGKCKRDNGCDKGCKYKHSSLLHDALMAGRSSITEPNGSIDQVEKVTSCACGPLKGDKSLIALPTVSVMVRGQGQLQFVKIRALLDPRSNRSFCSKLLIQMLGIQGRNEELNLETLNKDSNVGVKEVALEIKGLRRNHKCIVMNSVYAMDRIPSLKNSIITEKDVKEWAHLKELEVLDGGEVLMLIGQDTPEALIPLEVRSGNSSNEPYAVRTTLEWTLNGPMKDKSEVNSVYCNLIQTNEDINLLKQVEQFWKIDTGNLLAGDMLPKRLKEDQNVLSLWQKNVELNEGNYELEIPFKKPPDLPANRMMAEKRLHSLTKRLSSENLEKYNAGITDLLSNRFAEHVPGDVEPGAIWYIPHHNVFSKSKPDKFRIVFDCTAECKGQSLNKSVCQGPDLTNQLVGVLLRFREHSVAIMGDVEKMFLQVKVPEKHRDVLRFLWYEDGNINKPIREYRMTSHLFGGVWLPSCATFALRRTAEDNRNEYTQQTIQTVEDNFSVDDCLKSVTTEDEAKQLVVDLTSLLSRGGFRLTKWISNSKEVMETIPIEERSKELKDINMNTDILPVQALGVIWNTDTDTFGIKTSVKPHENTRRGLLKVMSSVYDPLGLVSPYVLLAKLISQDECRIGKGWDTELNHQNMKKWEAWLRDLIVIRQFNIDRCFISSHEYSSAQLHHFSDASESAYGLSAT